MDLAWLNLKDTDLPAGLMRLTNDEVVSIKQALSRAQALDTTDLHGPMFVEGCEDNWHQLLAKHYGCGIPIYKLRIEGMGWIITPEECIQVIGAMSRTSWFDHHPVVGEFRQFVKEAFHRGGFSIT